MLEKRAETGAISIRSFFFFRVRGFCISRFSLPFGDWNQALQFWHLFPKDKGMRCNSNIAEGLKIRGANPQIYEWPPANKQTNKQTRAFRTRGSFKEIGVISPIVVVVVGGGNFYCTFKGALSQIFCICLNRQNI